MAERNRDRRSTDVEQIAHDEAMKAAMKAAIDEWLEKKFAQFGKWSAYGLVATCLAALLMWVLAVNGWHKP